MKKSYIITIIALLILIVIQQIAYRNDIKEEGSLQTLYLKEIFAQYKGKVKPKDVQRAMTRLSSNNYKMFKYNEYNPEEVKQIYERYKNNGFQDVQSVFSYMKSLKSVANKNNCEILYIEIVPGTMQKTEEYTQFQLKLTFQSLQSFNVLLKISNKTNAVKIKL